jgi:hypothetical protein
MTVRNRRKGRPAGNGSQQSHRPHVGIGATDGRHTMRELLTSKTLLRLGAVTAAATMTLPSVAAASDDRIAPTTRTVDLACPADRVDGLSFGDTAGSVHSGAITCLSWYGIANGTGPGTYGTGRSVTRAQLASFLVRLLEQADVELPSAVDDAFDDDDGNTHEHSLDVLAALGIVNGRGDGTVRPDTPVSRDQMASLLVRVVELLDDRELAEVLEDYFDDDDDNVHEGAINALAALGLAAGRADRAYAPGADVLREQMATFLMRLVDLLVEQGDVRIPATLRLSAEDMAPGEVVAAVVLGDDISSVELVGCGLDGLVSDADPEAPGVQFSFTAPAAFPAEQDGEDDADECDLVAIVTFGDGSTQQLEAELELDGDREGSDDGANDDGADENGADEDGADEDGADEDGADEDGADEDGADEDGADEDGADEDGADEDGADEDGADEDGADEDGADDADDADEAVA